MFAGPEFQHYERYREKILHRLEKYYHTIQDQVVAARGVADSAAQRQRDDKGVRMLRRLAVGFGTLVLVGIAVFLMLVFGMWSVPEATRLRLALLVALFTLPMGLVGGAVARAGYLRVLHHRTAVSDAENAYERELTAAVREAITTSINEELGPEGIIAFPAHAPRLVELDTSQITPSATVRYVREFIVEHESSAIGLAGMRGSGKSTVMRALYADKDFQPYVVLVPSPVRYNSGEFVRRLLYEIAATIANAGLDRRIRDRQVAGRVARTRAALFAVIGPLTGLSDFRGSSEVRRARFILQSLRWEVERGMTSKNTVKLWSLVESAGENSWKAKSRSLTHSDLVTELRQLLRLFADNNPGTRLVVCIDELDKLGNPEHLVDIVNELKDLFHIQGVHFVVSVSTDALESFERRGLPSRDAFDSAFDAVIHTDWLTLEESLAVISARATGFAPPIGMFCHAWSGGLARDLLRTARAAVELQRRNPASPVTIGQIVTHIVINDLAAATTATLRPLDPADPDLPGLCELRQLLETVQTSAGLRGMPHRPGANLAFVVPAHQVLHSKVMLGLRLVQVALTLGQLDAYWDEQGSAMRGLAAIVTRVATAMAELSGPKPLRDQKVSAAIGEFDITSVNSDHGGEHRG